MRHGKFNVLTQGGGGRIWYCNFLAALADNILGAGIIYGAGGGGGGGGTDEKRVG